MQIEDEFIKLVSIRFSKAFERIIHAVHQLDDQQLWFRPSSTSNSIGIILQQVSGNLNQWVCSALGGDAFQRHRSQEFKDENIVSQKRLLLTLNALAKRIQEVLAQVAPESLLSYRRIQGFDETVMSALIAALTHLELHSGQITLIAKLMLNKDYQEFWQPLNKEQGKE